MTVDLTKLVKRIYANPEQQSNFAESIAAALDGDAIARIRADAELRVMRIAAGLFPGGYDNNFAKIRDTVALIDKDASHDRT